MSENPVPRRKNPVGLASLVFGILLVLLTLAWRVLSPALPRIVQSFDLPLSAVSLFMVVPSAVVAVIATILGIVGLLLRDRRRAAAIIGTTLGASTLINLVVGTVGSLLVAAVLS